MSDASLIVDRKGTKEPVYSKDAGRYAMQTVGIVQTTTLLLYLVIQGKLLHSDHNLWNNQVPLCPLYPILKMQRS